MKAWRAKADHPVSGTIDGCRIRPRLLPAGIGKKSARDDQQGEEHQVDYGGAASKFGISAVAARPSEQNVSAPTISLMSRAVQSRGRAAP